MKFICAVLAFVGLCAVCAHAAINPKPQLRVLMIHTPLGDIQEPASVTASFIGFVICVYNYIKLRRLLAKLPPGSWSIYPYKSMWYTTLFGVGSMCTASVLFHTHENKVTEGMDYTAAIWFIGMMSCASLLRAFRFYRTIWHRVVPFLVTMIPLCWHSHYMFFVKFDYGWNMKFGAIFVVVTASVWYVLCLYELLIAKPRVSHFAWALVAICLLSAFVPAEIWDFIPIWRTIDGHSVWHLGMDLFAYFFGEFVIRDIAFFAANNLKLSDAAGPQMVRGLRPGRLEGLKASLRVIMAEKYKQEELIEQRIDAYIDAFEDLNDLAFYCKVPDLIFSLADEPDKLTWQMPILQRDLFIHFPQQAIIHCEPALRELGDVLKTAETEKKLTAGLQTIIKNDEMRKSRSAVARELQHLKNK